MMQLSDDILGGKSVQTRRRDISTPLLLDLTSHYTMNTVTIKHFKIRTPGSSTNVRSNSMRASFCSTTWGPTNPGPTECHVMRGSQTSCKQPMLIAMTFSHLSAIEERAQQLYIHIRQWPEGGCGKVAYQLSKEFFAIEISRLQHQWHCYINVCVNFFQLLPIQSPVSIFEKHFSCMCLVKFTASHTHMHARAHPLPSFSCMFPYAHTHILSCCMHTTYRHSSFNIALNIVSCLCRQISTIKDLINSAWTLTNVVFAGRELKRRVSQNFNS
jgi:hypothetical protein